MLSHVFWSFLHWDQPSFFSIFYLSRFKGTCTFPSRAKNFIMKCFFFSYFCLPLIQATKVFFVTIWFVRSKTLTLGILLENLFKMRCEMLTFRFCIIMFFRFVLLYHYSRLVSVLPFFLDRCFCFCENRYLLFTLYQLSAE
jgi:hypothetical protein